jgi:hypothetical protein
MYDGLLRATNLVISLCLKSSLCIHLIATEMKWKELVAGEMHLNTLNVTLGWKLLTYAISPVGIQAHAHDHHAQAHDHHAHAHEQTSLWSQLEFEACLNPIWSDVSCCPLDQKRSMSRHLLGPPPPMIFNDQNGTQNSDRWSAVALLKSRTLPVVRVSCNLRPRHLLDLGLFINKWYLWSTSRLKHSYLQQTKYLCVFPNKTYNSSKW